MALGTRLHVAAVLGLLQIKLGHGSLLSGSDGSGRGCQTAAVEDGLFAIGVLPFVCVGLAQSSLARKHGCFSQ